MAKSVPKRLPREADLRSEDHERWADAMVVCSWGDGRCGADGYCHAGDCFKRERMKSLPVIVSLEERIERLEKRVAELEKSNNQNGGD